MWADLRTAVWEGVTLAPQCTAGTAKQTSKKARASSAATGAAGGRLNVPTFNVVDYSCAVFDGSNVEIEKPTSGVFTPPGLRHQVQAPAFYRRPFPPPVSVGAPDQTVTAPLDIG